MLTGGAQVATWVTIPEGFTATEIAARVHDAGAGDEDALKSYFLGHHLEGYLFPDTYDFMPNTAADAVAHRMYQEYKRKVEPELENAPHSRLSRPQVMTLASIIQREAILPQERPMIAAVSLNRLAKRMRLEMDPTVQYALGG